MYYVNWQRNVTVETVENRKVVVKRDKVTREFHDYVLAGAFTAISIMLGHPAAPRLLSQSLSNEGASTREFLSKIGIPTPRLISISPGVLVEEYVGIDLYRFLRSGSYNLRLVFLAGQFTGKLHLARYVFTDNKAGNFLVQNNDELVRTDLAFLQRGSSLFSRSMDIASFLASVMDLECYSEVEREFYLGYKQVTGFGFPYLSIILRNILVPGFSSDSKVALRNIFKNSDRLLAA